MRYTIEGFSQKYAMTLRKKVIKRDKEVEIKIDCTDLVILRWFVDFYPNMKKMIIEGKEYAWLTHNKLKTDLPLIDISKEAFNERMKKLVEFKILEYQFIKEGGSFSLYAFGENYINLISKEDGICSNIYGVEVQTSTGVDVQDTTKDNINNNIIIKDNKKERKPTREYDTIIDLRVRDEQVKTTIYEFIKMRKLIKKPMTNRALELMISKLQRIADNPQTAVEILEQSIMNNWQDIYELKNKKKVIYGDGYNGEYDV